MPSPPRVLWWIRTDLRLHDSPALHAALSLSPSVIYPVWTWDPHYVYHARVGPNRWQFLLDCQHDLSASLSRLNNKQKLLVVREGPKTVLPKLFKAWGITHLVFEKDPDVYASARDAEVTRIAVELGVRVVTRYGRTLWDSEGIVAKNRGPTMTIAALTKAGEAIGPVPKPLPVPEALPDPGDTDVAEIERSKPEDKGDVNAPDRLGGEMSYSHGIAGPNGDFAPPTMEELSLPAATTPHRGGETLALAALSKIIADKTYTATFSKPATAPTAFLPQSTTLLSPHLHFGSLSVRLFYHQVLTVIEEAKHSRKKTTDPPTSLTGQLLFRDMYFAAYLAIGEPFSRTVGNPHVRYIDWHLPTPVSNPRTALVGDPSTDLAAAQEFLHRWAHGTTGFPWIDAIMRQLRTEGWIHHLARHAVACFLTRGGCYVSWERGAEVFEELLLDHEPACNIGNWQWLSCTAFFSQYYRCYSPVAFPKHTDPEGAFVKRYCPELAGVPKRWIYEPWEAPGEVLQKAGVVLGREYPERMFVWESRRDACMHGMKVGFKAGLKGSDGCVVEGGKELERLLRAAEADVGGIGEGSSGKRKEHPKKKMEKGQGTLDSVFTKKARKG